MSALTVKIDDVALAENIRALAGRRGVTAYVTAVLADHVDAHSLASLQQQQQAARSHSPNVQVPVVGVSLDAMERLAFWGARSDRLRVILDHWRCSSLPDLPPVPRVPPERRARGTTFMLDKLHVDWLRRTRKQLHVSMGDLISALVTEQFFS